MQGFEQLVNIDDGTCSGRTVATMPQARGKAAPAPENAPLKEALARVKAFGTI
ncbi:MAG: hypothetical protein ACTS1X_04420 [Parasphingopyxis sp.]|uniref:hypothetical protein n=1 Tax=Parasphingopyxis sp. TaxID=1920299 RepID=UPI003FA06B4D